MENQSKIFGLYAREDEGGINQFGYFPIQKVHLVNNQLNTSFVVQMRYISLKKELLISID